MKKLTFVLTLLCFTVLSHAQLNENAQYIKDTYSTGYENTLKKYALQEWSDDYSMVVYEINKQANALFDIVESFESENTMVLLSAIKKWSIEGFESLNEAEFYEFPTLSIEYLLKLHCDWSMVKHEYDKQVKAKDAF